MANKLTPEQIKILLANMLSLKESKTEIAKDNTGKKKLKNIPLKNKKLEDAIYSYIQNKQDTYTGPSIGRYNEGAHNPNVEAEKTIQTYKENSDLAKTMGSFTPSGDSKIGAIGAETVANMTPMGSGQLLAAKRLASIFNNPKDNEYINESKGTFDNTLGAFNLLGDLGMIGGTLKSTGNIPKSSTILSKYANYLKNKNTNKFGAYEIVSEGINENNPKLIENKLLQNETLETLKNSNVNKKPKENFKYEIEEIPGLHLKSTMEGGPILKLIEPKTGLINTEQALSIIGKESDGAKKLELVKKALGENYPKKIDYNDFRKKVQNELIPLNKDIAEHASNYGLNRLGYDFQFGKFGKNIKPLENKSIILSNKEKFGTGSPAHSNPNETLGHAHYLIDKETPNVFTVTQLQSDAFQSTYGIMPKVSESEKALQKDKLSIERLERMQERNKSVLNKMKTEGIDEAGVPVSDVQIKQFEAIVKGQEEFNYLKKAHVKNFNQKQLLDKNHQERYLQEIVDFASKKKGVDKIRIPTKETAAKVQNYEKTNAEKVRNNIKQLTKEQIEADLKTMPENYRKLIERAMKGENFEMYKPEHETVLKKYEENAKSVKKLFGEEAKIVTDNKGNTWYEFDIPKKFKQGKGEIKAFSTAGAAALLGKKLLNVDTVNTLKNKNKNGKTN